MDPQVLSAATETCQTIARNIERAIVGKHEVVVDAVTALLAQGHILIEDVPGVGKTLLANALARSVGGEFKRIQFTADLLPSDITGVNVLTPDHHFTFRRGPLFCNVLLADEINRGTPRTQSSLLEAMEELQATVDGTRHELMHPFMVVATQNPIELEGTYPLPFAELDRFIVRLRIGYLSPEQERDMVRLRQADRPVDRIEPVLPREDLEHLQKLVTDVTITDALVDYAVSIVHRTRNSELLDHGASPRGTLDLVRFSQATALLAGRDYVLPDDIKRAAPPVLAHRVIVKRGTRRGPLDMDEFIDELVESIPVPI